MTREDTHALWKARVAAQQASGLSAIAWCFQQDVPLQPFYSWRRRLSTPATAPATPAWLTVAPEHAAALTLHVGPVTLDVCPGFDPQVLAAVLAVLATSR